MSASMRADYDFVIVGGGIAGAWLFNLLRQRGFAVLLIEAGTLGSGQTLASQGLIHGGIKYTLSATLTPAAEAIATMPARWRAALRGEGEVDLRAAIVLSDRYFLWSSASLSDRLTGFFASQSIRGRVQRIERPHLPAPFNREEFIGNVYGLEDFVIDVRSVLTALVQSFGQFTLNATITTIEHLANDGFRLGFRAPEHPQLTTRFLVLAAGAGNELLLQKLDRPSPRMQRRPLHQVWVRGSALQPLYGHCLTGIRNAEPRITVTTHGDNSTPIWSLGGALATGGVGRTAQEQIQFAKLELKHCVPWLQQRNLEWATMIIDRAEAKTGIGLKPDRAYLHWHQGVITTWPTKLTLAPDLGDQLLAQIEAQDIQPRASPQHLDKGATPAMANPLWEQLKWY